MFNYYEINLCNEENIYINTICISKNECEYDEIGFHISIT